MPIKSFIINDKEYQIVLPNKSYEPQYRQRLSKILIEKYGRVISNENIINALCDSYNFFTDEFSNAISKINDLTFYFFVFNLHEQTAELSYLRSVEGIKIPLEKSYFAQYRRILKLILQESCLVKPCDTMYPTSEWMKKSIGEIERLIFLGGFALDMVNIISEQKITEESIQIRFEKDLYVFDNSPKWRGFLNLFHDEFDVQVDGSIHDGSLQERFDTLLEKNFGMGLTALSLIIGKIADDLYNQIPPKLCTVDELINIFKNETSNPFVTNLINGLVLTNDNVAKLKSGIYSAYNGNRLIHRPLIRVDIDNTPCLLFGKFTFLEAINTLFQNQITHGKLPIEWKDIPEINTIWQEFIQYHKDILENPVEDCIKENNIIYDRNVKTLFAVDKKNNLSINNNPGEIDYIFIIEKKIYLADCKNLTKRYEMHGYYQDYNKFIPYERKMREKIDFMTNKRDRLEEHLKIISNKPELNIKHFDIEGIFIVNTPTMYSINAPFKTYSFHNFCLLIKGKDIFERVIVLPDENDTEISWPYIDNYKKHILPQNKE